MKVRYKVDFGGGAREGQRDTVDAPEVDAEHDEAPAAPDLEAAPQPQPVPRAARMLALAHHIDRLVEDGVLDDYAHAARVLGVTRARLSQIQNLLGLSPDIQGAILLSHPQCSERGLREVLRTPDWEDQRLHLSSIIPRASLALVSPL